MSEQFGDRTYDATPHRRQQAREQGQVAKSQDLASAVILLAALLILLWLGPRLRDNLGQLTVDLLGGDAWLKTDTDTAIALWKTVIMSLSRALLPILGSLMLVAVMGHLGQIGFLFLPQKLAVDPGRINPLKGIQRLLSLNNLVRLALGVGKVLVVAAVAAWSLWGKRDLVLGLSVLSAPEIAVQVVELTIWTCLKIAMALLILAIIDYTFQRWKHEQDLKMTFQELREEMRNLQGDPQILARRRQIQRQMVVNRLTVTVPEADVVITNPTELAVAVRYDHQTMIAPTVIAKGAGVLAQRIRRLALEKGIPIVERKPLARFLYQHVDINQPVPAEQYAAVAEVLRYVYELKGQSLPGLD